MRGLDSHGLLRELHLGDGRLGLFATLNETCTDGCVMVPERELRERAPPDSLFHRVTARLRAGKVVA